MTIKSTQTAEQAAAFKAATIAGYYQDYAIHKGGTGHMRPELSVKEIERRKARRKMAKASRKANR